MDELDRRRMTWRSRAYALPALLALGACSAEVVGDSGDSPVPGTGTGSPQGTGGTPASPGQSNGSSPGAPGGVGSPAPGSAGTSSNAPPVQAPSAAMACPTERVPFTPLRRLTRFEYANSVRALLGVDTSVAAEQLPVDEITRGFNNNAAVLTVSPLHAEKYVLVSETLAKAAVSNLSTLVKCDPVAKGEEACAREFAQSFGRRAFRRALTQEDEQTLMTAFAAGHTGGSFAEGIEVMIRAALQSPNFLYRPETAPAASPSDKLIALGPYEVATRLSYLIWGSGPDDALLDAAARGELGTREQVAEKVRGMLADPKARVAQIEFYNQWLGTSRLDITSKHTTLFPEYSAEVKAGMMQELPAFLEHVLWKGDRKLSTLLTASNTFVTPALAPIYGVPAPAGPGPSLVELPANQGRAGVLTQAGVMAVLAHPEQTSPVLRGKFVQAKFLCNDVPPPPDDVDISIPEIDPNATARERFSAHLDAGASCNGCHRLMDPIGFPFEVFDAMGRHRTLENGKTIDVSGALVGAETTVDGPFNGVRELADKLAQSERVKACVATQWFRYAVGRTEVEADTCSLASAQEAFSQSQGDLVELVVALAQTDALRFRGPEGQ